VKVYLACYRFGKKENPKHDFVFATIDRERYEKWFAGREFDDLEWRRYGMELTFRLTEDLPLGAVPDYVYRGGPGV
jgi:hypothetical protein